MRALIASVLALSAAAPAAGETLAEAMVSAQESNPALAAQRQRLNATREALPQAWAAALPHVSLTGSSGIVNRESENALLDSGRDETWAASANISQLLFGAGRVEAATRGARAQIAAAIADFEFARQTLLLDVTRAYADVRQAQAVVAARQTNVENLSRLLEYAQAQFEAGVITRTDVAQAQARHAQARTQLVQAQGAMAAAVQAYQRLVGHPPSELAAPAHVMSLPAELEMAMSTAADNSPILIAAQANTRLADANVDAAAAQGRLNLTLEGGYATGRDANSFGAETTTDSVGVRLSVPLYQGGAVRSRTRAQRALRAASNLDLASAQRAVEEGVTNAWTGLASARAAVASAREQVAAAELAQEGIVLEQEAGLRSTVEVLDQEADLLAARVGLAQAERDLVVAERQMLAAIGTLDAPQLGADAAEPNDQLRGR